MSPAQLPDFTYGAVYFRKSNPPEQDWERDYATAAADGYTWFRHWFLWSAIEIAPGRYDWADYDRQLGLAASHGMKTVIAEMITAAPEWLFSRLPHARYETRSGQRLESTMSGSCVTGGFPGLCLDNPEVAEAAGNFLQALAERYREHPGLGGYDIWNECTYWEDLCYCPATAVQFRQWLQQRYASLSALAAAWQRHSLVSWDDVQIPRHTGAYPDVLDWLTFRTENAYRWMAWRRDLLRAVDPTHPIIAHGVAGGLSRAAGYAADDWQAARVADAYGLTWIAARKGDEPWKQWHAVDLTRTAARGKTIWHAEAQGGPLWLQPQVPGRPREDGRIASPEDLRLWHLLSFAAGARGLFYPRWRPLLDGPLFGAFGPYGMDGGRTPRSQMAARIAHWAAEPEQAPMWQARPVLGELGILALPESQRFAHAQQGDAGYYTDAITGAYRGFIGHHLQPDLISLEDIGSYRLLYLPYPLGLSPETIERLRRWVWAGGCLVSEGCPAYLDHRGHVSPTQPPPPLAELFGAHETSVEFTPDLLADLQLTVSDLPARGGTFLQAYRPTTGKAIGWYEDGQVAAIENHWGQGRTLLVGSMLGAGISAHPDEPAPLLRWLLNWAGIEPHLCCSHPQVQARLHRGPTGLWLWVINPTREQATVQIALGSQWRSLSVGEVHWGGSAWEKEGRIHVTVGGRDATVVALG
ncbi:MAG: beta-galactosidase [Anaerolineae bacterium]|jgi:beta-galactosidase|nr:beta-galactosidase [Chloroflexota bacterium]